MIDSISRAIRVHAAHCANSARRRLIVTLAAWGRRYRKPGRAMHITGYVAALLCASSPIHSEIAQQADDQTTMHAVALLFHGGYGERPYNVKSTGAGTLALEEVGGGRIRFVVRAVPGKRCIFITTHDHRDGLNIEQLDFTRFDGTHQLRESCGPKGTILERECNASLYFKSEQGYCQYVFSSDRQVDLGNVPFPEAACRPLGYGARNKDSYAKYVVAFDYVFKQCAVALER
jgi:hypothetical protein